MKLVNSLVVAFLGTLMATGCTVTDDTSTDGGTNDGGGTDTTPVGDTGGAKDTAVSETSADTGGDASGTCGSCVSSHCLSEYTACTGDTQCKAGLDCFNLCPGSPKATRESCQNSCVTNAEADAGSSPKIDDIIGCVKTNCADPCGLNAP